MAAKSNSKEEVKEVKEVTEVKEVPNPKATAKGEKKKAGPTTPDELHTEDMDRMISLSNN